jgi:hypothetical protein
MPSTEAAAAVGFIASEQPIRLALAGGEHGCCRNNRPTPSPGQTMTFLLSRYKITVHNRRYQT